MQTDQTTRCHPATGSTATYAGLAAAVSDALRDALAMLDHGGDMAGGVARLSVLEEIAVALLEALEEEAGS